MKDLTNLVIEPKMWNNLLVMLGIRKRFIGVDFYKGKQVIVVMTKKRNGIFIVEDIIEKEE